MKLYSGCTVFLFYKYLCPHLKLMFGVDVCGKISHRGPVGDVFGISESAGCGDGVCSCLAGAVHLSIELFARLEKGTSTYLIH